jgi:hypothetical protein
MTSYSDVPAVNALYAERENVTNAITSIDGGGTLASFTIGPPPPDPERDAMSMAGGLMVAVQTGGEPMDPATQAALRGWCVQRQAAIDAELAALGVTGAPAASKAAAKA